MRDAGVSIESLIQRGAMPDGSVIVAIVTHEGPERSVAAALDKLRGSPSLAGEPMWMQILGQIQFANQVQHWNVSGPASGTAAVMVYGSAAWRERVWQDGKLSVSEESF